MSEDDHTLYFAQWLKYLFDKDDFYEATSKMLKASNHGLETIHEDELSRRRTDLSPGDSSRLIDITFLRFPSAASQTFKVSINIFESIPQEPALMYCSFVALLSGLNDGNPVNR
jgi:hypothetical protein